MTEKEMEDLEKELLKISASSEYRASHNIFNFYHLSSISNFVTPNPQSTYTYSINKVVSSSHNTSSTPNGQYTLLSTSLPSKASYRPVVEIQLTSKTVSLL